MELSKEDINIKWKKLTLLLGDQFQNEPPDLKGVLFLIGLQELGKGFQKFNKQEKQDLIHIAICTLLSKHGFYEYEGKDPDGWPHWKLNVKLPKINLSNQEELLKELAITYFEEQDLL